MQRASGGTERMVYDCAVRPSELPGPHSMRAGVLWQARAWRELYELLRQADALGPLSLEELWQLAMAAALSGHEAEAMRVHERIYERESENGDACQAARAAFWLGFRFMHLGEASRSNAWLLRAERQVARHGQDCVERGYLELPRARRAFVAGDFQAAFDVADRAVELGERFGDRDLAAFAKNLQGRVLIRTGQVEAGLRLHDEAMLSASSGGLSPTITGLVYCAAIDSCQSVLALDRVREWTDALSAWCESQPQLSLFTGECLVCRAEVMELAGDWAKALEEAQRARLNLEACYGPSATGAALYRQGELHRLRGELDLAEQRYREASDVGRDPQPGLSLLRLAQGKTDAAVQALRRATAVAKEPLARLRLLPAWVEALIVARHWEEAEQPVRELLALAERLASDAVAAHAAMARGALDLALGEAESALICFRRAFETWQRLAAPYLAAQARTQSACACRALGDGDGAALESEAARQVFLKLGAMHDVARVDALRARSSARSQSSGLSARELEVLRLVASGKTNKLIARLLCLSEKTVDRHVSNIFAKLNVPSRAAATAYAYERKLI